MKIDFSQELKDFEGQPVLNAALAPEEIVFLRQDYLMSKRGTSMSDEIRQQIQGRKDAIFSQARPVTLKQSCLSCLGQAQGIDEKEIDFLFGLGCKVGSATEPVDLFDEEIAFLKREIQKSNFPAIVKGRVRSLLDPKGS